MADRRQGMRRAALVNMISPARPIPKFQARLKPGIKSGMRACVVGRADRTRDRRGSGARRAVLPRGGTSHGLDCASMAVHRTGIGIPGDVAGAGAGRARQRGTPLSGRSRYPLTSSRIQLSISAERLRFPVETAPHRHKSAGASSRESSA